MERQLGKTHYSDFHSPVTRHAPLYVIQDRPEEEQTPSETNPQILLGNHLQTISLTLGQKRRDGRRLVIRCDHSSGIEVKGLEEKYGEYEISGTVGAYRGQEETLRTINDNIRLAVSLSTRHSDGKTWLTVKVQHAVEPTLIINRTMLSLHVDEKLLESEADPFFGQPHLLDCGFSELIAHVRKQMRECQYRFLLIKK